VIHLGGRNRGGPVQHLIPWQSYSEQETLCLPFQTLELCQNPHLCVLHHAAAHEIQKTLRKCMGSEELTGDGMLDSHRQKHGQEPGSMSGCRASSYSLSGRGGTTTSSLYCPVPSLPTADRAESETTSKRGRIPRLVAEITYPRKSLKRRNPKPSLDGRSSLSREVGQQR